MMDLSSALGLALPELILAIGSMVLLVAGAFMGNRWTGQTSMLAGGVLVAAAIAAAVGPQGDAFGGSFVMDQAAAFAKVIVYVSSAVVIVLGAGWLERTGNPRFEFPILILLAVLGMSVMVSAGDLLAVYIGLELQSLAIYVLAAFQRDDAKSSEAGLKYFVLGALSSGLLLYGISLTYGYVGSIGFREIAATVADGADTGVIFGLVFVITGLAFKVSAAPFHMWTPDVYEGAPTPVVIFSAAASKFAAMVLIVRVLADGFAGAIESWRQVLIAVSVVSFLIGAFGGLMQRDLKRLFAYSSIANVGYALLGLSAGTEAGLQALFVFMTLYLVDTTALFACLMALNRAGRPMGRIEDLAGLKRVKPGVALALTGLSLSVLGMPPFAGFWSKYYVFKASIDAGLWPVAVAGLMASVVAAFYYLRIIKVMWFDPAPGEVDASPTEARWVAIGGALFSFPLVLVALTWLDPMARSAAAAFGLR
jgi:NADH-quinone oxidoreductase subunit N